MYAFAILLNNPVSSRLCPVSLLSQQLKHQLLVSFSLKNVISTVNTEIIEDVPGAGEMVELGQNIGAAPCAVSPPSQERESYKKLGLTKQVLAAHTQKEEQAFLHRFKDLSRHTALKDNCSQYLERQRQQIHSDGTTEHQTDTLYNLMTVAITPNDHSPNFFPPLSCSSSHSSIL